MAGIICIETEWQLTVKDNRRSMNSEPLIEYLHEMYGVPYIYRKIATLEELKYYIKQLKRKEYDKYNVLYFSFHGWTHTIHLEGGNELTIEDLAKLADGAFNDKFVHFSSCRTMGGSQNVIKQFKEISGAKVVSGYTKTVPTDLSAVFDIALIGEFLKSSIIPKIFERMNKLYEGLSNKLGFRYEY